MVVFGKGGFEAMVGCCRWLEVDSGVGDGDGGSGCWRSCMGIRGG